MIDPFVLLTPILLVAIFSLLRFVGCLSKPSPPGPHIAAVPGDGKVFLSWELFTSETFNGGYHVKRGTSPGGPYSTIGNTSVALGAFTDRGLTNGITYYYVVTQDTSDGESKNSNEVFVVPAPIAFRQKTEALVPSDNNNNTDTVETPPFVNVNSGALIVVWIWYNTTTQSVTTVSDTTGNLYQRAGNVTAGTVLLAGWQQELWYTGNATGGSVVAVHALFTGKFTQQKAISAHEYSGASPGAPFFDDPLDVPGAAASADAAVTSGSAAAADAGLIFGAAIFSDSGSVGPGFVQRESQKGNLTEDARVAGPGPAEAVFANPHPGQSWIAQMAVFR
jgi:hypothetical protein